MSMQDPIADMLTRIRNAQKAGEVYVKLPASKLKIAILQILQEEGYIQGYESVTMDGKKDLKVALKYYHGR